jgi:hypothetical protein
VAHILNVGEQGKIGIPGLRERWMIEDSADMAWCRGGFALLAERVVSQDRLGGQLFALCSRQVEDSSLES